MSTFFGILLIVLRLLVISSPIFPSPRDKPETKTPSIYFRDAVIPSIFGLPEITWLQAFGLWTFLVLIRSSKIDYKSLVSKKETGSSEPSPFGDNTWNQWVEQVRKKYQA